MFYRLAKTGGKLEGFTMLLYRCRNMSRVESDLHLIGQLLKKADKTPDKR
jgi:hypothetical protein